MNPQTVSVLLVGGGMAINACWTIFNARFANRVLEQIDGVKDWVRESYYDRDYVNQLELRIAKTGH